MPEFTVQAASKKKDVQGKHGPMQVINLVLQNGSGAVNAEWFTKATTPLPATGTKLEGDLEDGQYGKNFKKAQQQQGGFQQRAPFKEDPAKTVRILRQHSQHMAIQAVEVAMGAGIQERPESFEELLKLVRRTADFMDRDVETAVANSQLSAEDAARRSEETW